jgi:hypothetical protein
MESYLYPPKYPSSAAIATLALPSKREAAETEALKPSSFSDGLDTASRQINEIPATTALSVPG